MNCSTCNPRHVITQRSWLVTECIGQCDLTDSPELPKKVLYDGVFPGKAMVSGLGAEKGNPIVINEDKDLLDNTVRVSLCNGSKRRSTESFKAEDNEGSSSSIGRGQAR